MTNIMAVLLPTARQELHSFLFNTYLKSLSWQLAPAETKRYSVLQSKENLNNSLHPGDDSTTLKLKNL